MNIKTLRKIIILSIVLVVALASSYYLYSTNSDDDAQHTSAVNPSTNSAQEYFNEKLHGGVIDRIGQPIEGFVPFMFMQAFSGLVFKDFYSADAMAKRLSASSSAYCERVVTNRDVSSPINFEATVSLTVN